jgi:hypothetical protein
MGRRGPASYRVMAAESAFPAFHAVTMTFPSSTFTG